MDVSKVGEVKVWQLQSSKHQAGADKKDRPAVAINLSTGMLVMKGFNPDAQFTLVVGNKEVRIKTDKTGQFVAPISLSSLQNLQNIEFAIANSSNKLIVHDYVNFSPEKLITAKSLIQEDKVIIFGTGYPGHNLEVYLGEKVEPTRVNVDENGRWMYEVPKDNLPIGDDNIKFLQVQIAVENSGVLATSEVVDLRYEDVTEDIYTTFIADKQGYNRLLETQPIIALRLMTMVEEKDGNPTIKDNYTREDLGVADIDCRLLNAVLDYVYSDPYEEAADEGIQFIKEKTILEDLRTYLHDNGKVFSQLSADDRERFYPALSVLNKIYRAGLIKHFSVLQKANVLAISHELGISGISLKKGGDFVRAFIKNLRSNNEMIQEVWAKIIYEHPWLAQFEDPFQLLDYAERNLSSQDDYLNNLLTINGQDSKKLIATKLLLRHLLSSDSPLLKGSFKEDNIIVGVMGRTVSREVLKDFIFQDGKLHKYHQNVEEHISASDKDFLKQLLNDQSAILSTLRPGGDSDVVERGKSIIRGIIGLHDAMIKSNQIGSDIEKYMEDYLVGLYNQAGIETVLYNRASLLEEPTGETQGKVITVKKPAGISVDLSGELPKNYIDNAAEMIKEFPYNGWRFLSRLSHNEVAEPVAAIGGFLWNSMVDDSSLEDRLKYMSVTELNAYEMNLDILGNNLSMVGKELGNFEGDNPLIKFADLTGAQNKVRQMFGAGGGDQAADSTSAVIHTLIMYTLLRGMITFIARRGMDVKEGLVGKEQLQINPDGKGRSQRTDGLLRSGTSTYEQEALKALEYQIKQFEGTAYSEKLKKLHKQYKTMKLQRWTSIYIGSAERAKDKPVKRIVKIIPGVYWTDTNAESLIKEYNSQIELQFKKTGKYPRFFKSHYSMKNKAGVLQPLFGNKTALWEVPLLKVKVRVGEKTVIEPQAKFTPAPTTPKPKAVSTFDFKIRDIFDGRLRTDINMNTVNSGIPVQNPFKLGKIQVTINGELVDVPVKHRVSEHGQLRLYLDPEARSGEYQLVIETPSEISKESIEVYKKYVSDVLAKGFEVNSKDAAVIKDISIWKTKLKAELERLGFESADHVSSKIAKSDTLTKQLSAQLWNTQNIRALAELIYDEARYGNEIKITDGLLQRANIGSMGKESTEKNRLVLKELSSLGKVELSRTGIRIEVAESGEFFGKKVLQAGTIDISFKGMRIDQISIPDGIFESKSGVDFDIRRLVDLSSIPLYVGDMNARESGNVCEVGHLENMKSISQKSERLLADYEQSIQDYFHQESEKVNAYERELIELTDEQLKERMSGKDGIQERIKGELDAFINEGHTDGEVRQKANELLKKYRSEMLAQFREVHRRTTLREMQYRKPIIEALEKGSVTKEQLESAKVSELWKQGKWSELWQAMKDLGIVNSAKPEPAPIHGLENFFKPDIWQHGEKYIRQALEAGITIDAIVAHVETLGKGSIERNPQEALSIDKIKESAEVRKMNALEGKSSIKNSERYYRAGRGEVALGIRLYQEQLKSAINQTDAAISEQGCGTGKTKVSGAAQAIIGSFGRGVHMYTSSDMLAMEFYKEQASTMDCFFGRGYGDLNIGPKEGFPGKYEIRIESETIGILRQDDPVERKRSSLEMRMTVGEKPSFAFAFLDWRTGNMEGLRRFFFAVADEVDFALLAQGKTPHILSDGGLGGFWKKIASVKVIKESYGIADKMVEGKHFKVKGNQVEILLEGRRFISQQTNGWKSIVKFNKKAVLGQIHNALVAKCVYKMDVDYKVVKNEKTGKYEIELITKENAQLAKGSKLQDGLHQQLEFKERIKVTPMTGSIAEINTTDFSGVYQLGMSGLTGTAADYRHEFSFSYNTGVQRINPHYEDRLENKGTFYFTKDAQMQSNLLADINADLRPEGKDPAAAALIGTRSPAECHRLAIEAYIQDLKDTGLYDQKIDERIKNERNSYYEFKKAYETACKGKDNLALIQTVGERINVFDVTDPISKEKSQLIFEKEAGKPGHKTFMTAVGGRGADWALNGAKGFVVFVTDLSEHGRGFLTQLEKRAGRNGEWGAFKLFVSFESETLKKHLKPGNYESILSHMEYLEQQLNEGKITQEAFDKKAEKYAESIITYFDNRGIEARVGKHVESLLVADMEKNIYSLKDHIRMAGQNAENLPNLRAELANRANRLIDAYIEIFRQGDMPAVELYRFAAEIFKIPLDPSVFANRDISEVGELLKAKVQLKIDLIFQEGGKALDVLTKNLSAIVPDRVFAELKTRIHDEVKDVSERGYGKGEESIGMQQTQQKYKVVLLEYTSKVFENIFDVVEKDFIELTRDLTDNDKQSIFTPNIHERVGAVIQETTGKTVLQEITPELVKRTLSVNYVEEGEERNARIREEDERAKKMAEEQGVKKENIPTLKEKLTESILVREAEIKSIIEDPDFTRKYKEGSVKVTQAIEAFDQAALERWLNKDPQNRALFDKYVDNFKNRFGQRAVPVGIGILTLFPAEKVADVLGIEDPILRFISVVGMAHVGNALGAEGWTIARLSAQSSGGWRALLTKHFPRSIGEIKVASGALFSSGGKTILSSLKELRTLGFAKSFLESMPSGMVASQFTRGAFSLYRTWIDSDPESFMNKHVAHYAELTAFFAPGIAHAVSLDKVGARFANTYAGKWVTGKGGTKMLLKYGRGLTYGMLFDLGYLGTLKAVNFAKGRDNDYYMYAMQQVVERIQIDRLRRESFFMNSVVFVEEMAKGVASTPMTHSIFSSHADEKIPIIDSRGSITGYEKETYIQRQVREDLEACRTYREQIKQAIQPIIDQEIAKLSMEGKLTKEKVQRVVGERLNELLHDSEYANSIQNMLTFLELVPCKENEDFMRQFEFSNFNQEFSVSISDLDLGIGSAVEKIEAYSQLIDSNWHTDNIDELIRTGCGKIGRDGEIVPTEENMKYYNLALHTAIKNKNEGYEKRLKHFSENLEQGVLDTYDMHLLGISIDSLGNVSSYEVK